MHTPSHQPVTPLPASDPTAPPPPSLGVRVAVALTSTLLALVLAEGVVRVADGGAFTQLALFTEDPVAGIRLVPGRQALRRPAGGTYTVTLGPHGLRAPGGAVDAPDAAPTWLVLGDSQVLGLGVEDDEGLAFAAPTPDLRLQPVAVPGYGVEDALRLAEHLLPLLRPAGVVVVVNQANDWDEAGSPVEARHAVAGGWLLSADAPAWARAFFGSPLAHLHLLHHAVTAIAARHRVAPPIWARDAEATAEATGRIGGAITGFAARHPHQPVLVAYLPLDAATSPERAEASPYAAVLPGAPPDLAGALRVAVLGLPVVDLTDTLRDPASFLAGDYHLSPGGHLRVARALHGALAERREEEPP